MPYHARYHLTFVAFVRSAVWWVIIRGTLSVPSEHNACSGSDTREGNGTLS